MAVGIDVGGTAIKVGVVNRAGEVLGRGKLKTAAEEGTHEVLKRIQRAVREACDEANVKQDSLACAGIGAPGAVDPRRGMVLEAVNLHWTDFPLQEELENRLGVPVTLENDVTAAVYAENQHGAGEQSRHLLGVWLGTGMGGGLILEGRVYHGHFLTAGEIGRGVILPWAPPGGGSLDHIVSRTGMAETIRRLLRSGRQSRITDLVEDLDQIGSGDIAEAFRMRDELMVDVVEHAGHILGAALGGVITFLSLGRVVIGGGLTEALGEPFLEIVRRSAQKIVFPERCRQVRIVPSRLGDDAGPIGAALLAFARVAEGAEDHQPPRRALRSRHAQRQEKQSE